MQYRHAYHAGNFADVHKHVTLLALLEALQRKDKGFLYLDTHAGRGWYDLADAQSRHGEAEHGVERLLHVDPRSEAIRDYATLVRGLRSTPGQSRCYPGSPVLAAHRLRAQDRGVCVEWLAPEARALGRALAAYEHIHPEQGDGYERLTAVLPPRERRALALIDPPYEAEDEQQRAGDALAAALERFPTGVYALWFPVKRARDAQAWLSRLAAQLTVPALVSQLWVHPRDSAVALNGSGMLVVNPPWQLDEQMQAWLPELAGLLGAGENGGGTEVTWLRPPQ